MHVRLVFFAFVFLPPSLFAGADSLQLKMEYAGNYSSDTFRPMYQTSDKFGLGDSPSPAGYLRFGLKLTGQRRKVFAWQLGSDAVYQPFQPLRLQQLYARLRGGPLELVAGKFEQTLGLDSTLSSGSLLQSANASPIPGVAIVSSFIDVPFTGSFVAVSARLGHRWLGTNTSVQNAWLHEKALMLRLGGKLPVRAFAGLSHMAFWGGTHDAYGKLPDKFPDFLSVVFGQNGGESSLPPEAQNALGNHLGVVEYAMEGSFQDFRLMIYNQIPFEDGSGIGIVRRDGLRGVSLKNTAVTGMLRAITFENLSTTWQSGPSWIPSQEPGQEPTFNFRGNDNFYNNYLYRSGWTYAGKVIGSPLFHTWTQAADHFKLSDNKGPGIANNRIKAHHLGVLLRLSGVLENVSYVTWSQNYGTYENPYAPAGGSDLRSADGAGENSLEQWYVMTEFRYQIRHSLRLSCRFSADYGEISRNFGVGFSLQFLPGLKLS